LGIGYLLLQFISSFWARLLMVISFSFIVVMQFILFLYFGESRNLLGADMFYYSSEEMKQILEASGMLSFTNIALLLLLIVISWVPLWIANKQTFKKPYASIALLHCYFWGLYRFSSPRLRFWGVALKKMNS